MSFFTVDVLTPSRIVAKGLAAEMVVVPTYNGEIQILPHHTHIIEKLDTGIVTIKNGEHSESFSVTTGICKLLDNKLQIIANVCEKQSEINKDRAEKALALSKNKLSGAESITQEEWIKYQRKAQRAEIRLKLLVMGR